MGKRFFLGVLCFYLAFFANISSGFIVEKILQETQNATGVSLVDLYIPTVNSKNEKCRNHSLYYLHQLKNYTLWASEMFDASTKFPSGILYGSAYDFGNFDECLEVRVPYQNDQFSGQYCMAKITVESPFESDNVGPYNYHFDDYKNFYNVSVWKKIEDFLHDASKNPRNELFFSYCLPSSCSGEDLQAVLAEFFDKVNQDNDFSINVEVNRKTCQLAAPTRLDTRDIIFIVVVLVFIFKMIAASIYDSISKRDDFQHVKLAGKLHDVILCFSFPRNFKKLTTTKVNPDGLDCLSGMKVYSMVLIILLHRNMFDYGSALTNPKFVEQFYSNFGMTFILNGPILVDTFFTISGFLATYLILNQYYRSKNGINLALLYLHRYIRMTSVYCIILAFYCTLFVKIGSGPLWQERVGTESEKCRHVWWANMLYINNYVDTKNYCMFQSWYMACDMNGFIFVPIMCWIIWKKAKVGIAVVVVAIVASVLTVFTVVFLNEEQPILLIYLKMLLSPNSDSTFLTVYIPGHMRISSYFVGVLAGYLKYKMKANDIKIPRKWVKGGWIICVPLLLLALQLSFVFYASKPPVWSSALYAALHHLVWSLCIGWMIIAISFGYGPWVNGVLSWSPLVVLSRLSYSVYLCHGAIQMYSSGVLRDPIYASNFNAIHKSAADIILGYFLAFVLTMVFESPIIGLEKIILWKEKKKTNNTTVKDETLSDAELPSTYVAT